MVAFKHAPHPSQAPTDQRPGASPRMRLATEVQGPVEEDQGDRILGRIDGRMDRRVYPRQALSLRVGGRRLDHTVEARREPCLHLSMHDVSLGGLCATSQTPLALGERVAVFFPPQGAGRGWDAYGRVLRVTPQKQGYRIAVSFDPLQAA